MYYRMTPKERYYWEKHLEEMRKEKIKKTKRRVALLLSGVALIYGMYNYVSQPSTPTPIHYKEQQSFVYEEEKKSKEERYMWFLSRLEKKLGFDKGFLVAVGYVESKFDQNAKSNKGAYGVMQVTKSAYDEIKRLYGVSKRVIDKYIVKNSLENIDVRDPYTYKNVVFNEKGKSLPDQNRKNIAYVYIPFYLAYKELGVENISWQDVVNDAEANMVVGALYMFYIKNYFKTLQLVNVNGRDVLIRRDWEFLDKNDHLRVVPKEYDIYLWAAYNMGVNDFEKTIIEKKYVSRLFWHVPKETKIGIVRMKAFLSPLRIIF